MQEAEKIWMNGALVDWPDARVHVLSHGLHYGTTVFEGIRAYDAEGGTAVFRLDDHLARLERSARDVPHAPAVRAGEIRHAVHQVVTANGLGGCYIRPIALRGYGTMGLFPLEAPVDVAVAAWEWGAYLGEEGCGRASAPRSPAGAASARPPSRRRPRPAASTSTRSSRRSSRTRPATRRPSSSTRPATWPTARARTSSSCATASLVTPPRPRLDPRGHHAGEHHRAGRRRGHPGGRARGRPRRALHGRRGLHHRDGRRGLPGQRGRRPRARPARPGDAPAAGPLLRRHRGPRPALGRVAGLRRGAGGVAGWRERADRHLRHHAARRHAARGPQPVRGRAARRGAAAGRLRLRLPRGRLPGQQPEVRRALPAARGRGPRRHPPGRLRHDPPPRRRRVRGPGHAWPGRVRRPGGHARGQDLGPPHREGHARLARGEPADDRGVGRLPRGRGQGGRLRRRALLRRLRGPPGLRARLPARRPRPAAPPGSRPATPTAPPCRRASPRSIREVRAALPGAALGIHTHNDAECARGQQPRRRRRGRADGAGHDQRLRRALRQRQPDLDHPVAEPEDGLPHRRARAPRRAHRPEPLRGRDGQPGSPTSGRRTSATTPSPTRAGCTSRA